MVPDRLYLNKGGWAFVDITEQAGIQHSPSRHTGVTMVDINHDGHPDIITLDMLAEDNYRQKILKGPEDHIFYAKLREDGFHEQYMRNAGEEVLVHWRDAVLDQVPGGPARFPTYESFAAATVREALTDAERQRATRVVARVAESSVFENLEGSRLLAAACPPGPSGANPIDHNP